MREKISRLARGILDTEVPIPEWKQTIIEETIACGQIYRGDFCWSSKNHLAFRGLIYSDHPQIRVLQESFGGQKVELSYEVDATYLEAGDKLEGYFSLVTNGGEFNLPYHFFICAGALTGESRVQTGEQFVELAREEEDLALRLFESREFVQLPFMQDMGNRALYDGLRRTGNNRRSAMEEFLAGLGLKKNVVLSLQGGEHIYHDLPQKAPVIGIKRDTWGYVNARVTTDCPFLRPEKTVITSADFIGNLCEFSYFLDEQYLHAGKNRGVLQIQSFRQTLTLVVTVMREAEEKKVKTPTPFRKHLVRYRRAQLALQMEKAEKKELLNIMQREWKAIYRSQKPSLRLRLEEARLAWEWECPESFAQMIQELQPQAQKERWDDPEAFFLFLFLQAQASQDKEQKNRLEKLLQRYQEEKGLTVMLYLLLLSLGSDEQDAVGEVLEKLEDFYARGSRTPELYAKTCQLYRKNPEQIKRLSPFVVQSLWFGARNEYLTEEIVGRIAQFAVLEREYSTLLFQLLAFLYRKMPTQEMLSAICSLLIRGDRRNPEDFVWYEKGVKEDLHLTRLYDYYLETMPDDPDHEMPQEILLYYSYNSPGDLRSRQMIYRYVLRNFHEESRIYRVYERQMQKFSVDQLLEGRINPFLAELYPRMLYPQMVDERMSEILPDLIKTCQIRVNHPYLQYVVVVYGELSEEKMAPIHQGVAYIPVYPGESRILFVDLYGNRYANVEYEIIPLMSEGEELLDRCRTLLPEHPMLQLETCQEILRLGNPGRDQLDFLFRMAKEKSFHPLYRKQLTAAMISICANEEKPGQEAILFCLSNPMITREERKALIQALVSQGLVQEAWRQVQLYGYSLASPLTLSILVKGVLKEKNGTPDRFLLLSCYFLWKKNQETDEILRYLCRHYNGESKQMLSLLRHAQKKKMDTADLEERVFGQMLFTGNQEDLDEIYHVYRSTHPQETLLGRAYMVLQCSRYFFEEKVISNNIMEDVKKAWGGENCWRTMPEICRLAITLHFSTRAELTDEEKKLAEELVSRLCREGRTFAYFKKLGRSISLPDEVCDKTWIEYRGREEEMPYLILYHNQKGKKCLEEAEKMEMHSVYPGIFVRSVLLFDGEKVDYEIVALRNGKREVVRKGILEADITPQTAKNRFALLNHLQTGCQNPQDEQWQEKVREYGVRDALICRVFLSGEEMQEERRNFGWKA